MAATIHLRPPSSERAALEPLSCASSARSTPPSPLFLSSPAGDGHPVLVLPGFVGSDRSTAPLRRLLRRRGHDAHGWLLGPTTAPTSR